MNKLSLSDRLVKYYKDRASQKISGGEMERLVSSCTTYKPSTISRRLRELSEEGILIATYERKTVHYQFNNRTAHASQPSPNYQLPLMATQ